MILRLHLVDCYRVEESMKFGTLRILLVLETNFDVE